MFILCFELRELGKLCCILFLCFIFVRTFRGYVKISYVCLLFWPCPLLNLSSFVTIFIIILLINLFLFDTILGVSARFIYVMAGPRQL